MRVFVPARGKYAKDLRMRHDHCGNGEHRRAAERTVYRHERLRAQGGPCHADGVLKCANSFEHVDPAVIGNKRRFLLSEISGKSAIYDKIKNYFPKVDKNGREMAIIAEELKNLAVQGYQFEAAEASFILRVSRHSGTLYAFVRIDQL